MPSGTSGFYFSIGGNLETALFDTGSMVNVIDPPTADKIGIEKYPQTKPLDLDMSTRIPSYLVPISLPGVVSFVAPAYVYDLSPMNAMNIMSAPQFLDNGIPLFHIGYNKGQSNNIH
ncbi:MAG TPA: retropepsin-like aspartic protease [Candidatus Bathyarchaeia archaeon]|nr:retropepsin-like aspartic protease [Candidatus Bathyarchaeia archaeon]